MSGLDDSVLKALPSRLKREELLFATRKHVVLLLKELSVYALVMAAVFSVMIIAATGNRTARLVYSSLGWPVFLLVAVTIIFLAYARYFDWKYDIFMLTDRRIIDFNKYFPWRRIVKEAELAKVQDSLYDINGPLGQLFNYGNITIETAGEENNFEWQGIPFPDEVQNTLRLAVDLYEGEHQQGDAV